MKILFLTTHYPFPPDYGAAKRAYHLFHILKEIGEVTLVVLKYSDCNEQARLMQTRGNSSSLKVLYADCKPQGNLKGKIDRLFRMKKVESRHFSLSEQGSLELKELVRGSDMVWCHTLKAADMGGIYDYGWSVVDLDDLNSNKLALQAQAANFYTKWKMLWQAMLWRRWEKDSLRRFTVVSVCSELDRQKFRGRRNVFSLPNGFEAPKRPYLFKKCQDKVIGFVGILGYPPNAEAVRWFVQKIFPIVLKAEPAVRFRVAGKLPTGGLGINHDQVDVLGFVEDLDAEIQNWDAMVVPLKVGGGTRLKILEAFSKRIPVISTRLGAYGIEAVHGRHILLADEPLIFAEQCLQLIHNRKMSEHLTSNAYQLYSANYTWEIVSKKVKKIIEFIELCHK